ncbi:hypothetical protein LTR09_008645 [Extremus antarcticus]|uniref:DUF7029 domain-containing protein n=1 Tax=Extremus antarcticus TaxID=702011 RepID=A0AAJ0DH03_9PEZI|nr:hypothetical protein LTR09_008645 [Extremus antarcticus]
MALQRTLLVLLAAISQIGLSTASPFAYPSRVTHQGSPKHQRNFNKYHPIDPSSLSDYEGRDITANAGVGDSGNPHANLTAYTADGQNVRVLSLERFQNVLENAKCTKTSVEFTFLSEVNFDRVQKEWGWINDAEDHYLVLVTENARCNIPDGD